MNRTLQGCLFIVASILLFIKNIDSLIGAAASLLFIVGNVIGLILHKRKQRRSKNKIHLGGVYG